MNLTKKMILALGVFAAGVSYAQTAPTVATTESNPVGLLGQSYTEASFGATDIRHFSKDQYSLGVVANAPIAPNFDFSAGYDYSWFNDLGHANSVFASVTAYTTLSGGAKPFVAGAVGYTWERYSVFRDDYATWGGAVGVEIPVGSLTLTPRIVYADDFRGSADSVNQWSYGVDANYWLNRKLAIFGAVDYIDIDGADDGAYAFTAGVRYKF